LSISYQSWYQQAPLDERRLVFPPTFSLFVAAIVWQIYKAIFPLAIVHLVAAGTMIGIVFKYSHINFIFQNMK